MVECYALSASGSVHTKLEARVTLRYVQCGTYKNRLLSSLGGCATFANKYIACSDSLLRSPIIFED